MNVKGWLRLFPDFGLFCKINQKCSRVASNFHINMRVGAFETSDNEETFSFLFHGLKTYRKVSRRTQTWQPLCFSWLILDSLQSISYKVAKMGHEKHKSCQVWVRLETFLHVLKPWNTYEKVSSLSELSNAPTLIPDITITNHSTIGAFVFSKWT